MKKSLISLGVLCAVALGGSEKASAVVIARGQKIHKAVKAYDDCVFKACGREASAEENKVYEEYKSDVKPYEDNQKIYWDAYEKAVKEAKKDLDGGSLTQDGYMALKKEALKTYTSQMQKDAAFKNKRVETYNAQIKNVREAQDRCMETVDQPCYNEHLKAYYGSKGTDQKVEKARKVHRHYNTYTTCKGDGGSELGCRASFLKRTFGKGY